jgi:UPF0716 family protein affecting phage T7 exclusion
MIGTVLTLILLSICAYMGAVVVYHTDFSKLYRIATMDTDRLVEGEAEANQSIIERFK